MVWRDHQRANHRERGGALTLALEHKRAAENGRWAPTDRAAYESPLGMPVHDRVGMRKGSRGGAPIWVAREAFQPVTLKFKGSACTTCGSNGHLSSQHEASADPDGFAVYGRYPAGFLDHVIRSRWLGDVVRDEVLHVCSGTLGPVEAWTVDLRPEARPRVIASGTALPFRGGAFKAVMLDPPYSDRHARNLYGVENPRPSWLLREAARVVRPGGRIGLLHVALPFAPKGCRLVTVHGVTTGVGFRIRAFSIWEREQDSLFGALPSPADDEAP